MSDKTTPNGYLTSPRVADLFWEYYDKNANYDKQERTQRSLDAVICDLFLDCELAVHTSLRGADWLQAFRALLFDDGSEDESCDGATFSNDAY